MTEPAAALADTSNLDDFEGVPVTRTQVAITNAGDGLSEALSIEPTQLPIGATVYIVLECVAQQIKFSPVDRESPQDGLARTHVLRAGRSTIVDRSAVDAALNDQTERLRVAREHAAGISRLATSDEAPFGPTPDEDMTDEEWEAKGGATVSDAADLRNARDKKRRR